MEAGKISVNQVGKRWFLVTAESVGRALHIDVEASYSVGDNWNGRKFVTVTRWTLTGKGARKHRNQIITALEKHLTEMEDENK